MSGIESTLIAQLGVKLNISMDSTIVWFVWDKDEPLEPWRVHKAVTDGGMGLTEFFILGDFTFENGRAKTTKGIDLKYEGDARKAGRYAVEIMAYEEEEMELEVFDVKDYFQPKVFRPETE